MLGFSRLGPSIQFPCEAQAPCPRVVDPEENLPSLHTPLRGLLSDGHLMGREEPPHSEKELINYQQKPGSPPPPLG